MSLLLSHRNTCQILELRRVVCDKELAVEGQCVQCVDRVIRCGLAHGDSVQVEGTGREAGPQSGERRRALILRAGKEDEDVSADAIKAATSNILCSS